eukprot:SAG22_NODE_4636_length_1208_cov_1.589720_1_plen_215_part_10
MVQLGGFVLERLLVCALGWESVYRLAGLVLAAGWAGSHLVDPAAATEKHRAALKTSGASYCASICHAALVTVRGCGHLAVLLGGASEAAKLSIDAAPAGSSVEREQQAILVSCHLFLGYLLVDLCHVVAHYPALGGLDMLAHHGIFIFCAAGAGYCRVLGFAFSWLIIGEASTVLLGVRWLLINTGRGESAGMVAANVLFGAHALSLLDLRARRA